MVALTLPRGHGLGSAVAPARGNASTKRHGAVPARWQLTLASGTEEDGASLPRRPREHGCEAGSAGAALLPHSEGTVTGEPCLSLGLQGWVHG